MNGRGVPWWLWLVFGSVVLALVVLAVVYLQKSGSLDSALTQQDVRPPGVETQPVIDWGIRKTQENEDYHTVRLVGIIEDVATQGTNTYLYLKNPSEDVPGGVRIDLGIDQSELGVFFPDPDAESYERTWSNAKLTEIKEKLVIGSRAEVEVITWLKPEFDCEGNASCIERVGIYQKHEEDNAQMDRLIFDISDATVITEFSNGSFGLTFGPVNTLMVVQ